MLWTLPLDSLWCCICRSIWHCILMLLSWMVQGLNGSWSDKLGRKSSIIFILILKSVNVRLSRLLFYNNPFYPIILHLLNPLQKRQLEWLNFQHIPLTGCITMSFYNINTNSQSIAEIKKNIMVLVWGFWLFCFEFFLPLILTEILTSCFIST